MCETLGVKSQNYYRWKIQERKREEKRLAEIPLINRIEKIFNDSDKTYGYRAIKRELEEQDILISEYKIRKKMRRYGKWFIHTKNVSNVLEANI